MLDRLAHGWRRSAQSRPLTPICHFSDRWSRSTAKAERSTRSLHFHCRKRRPSRHAFSDRARGVRDDPRRAHLDAIESLIGPEISRPVQHVRLDRRRPSRRRIPKRDGWSCRDALASGERLSGPRPTTATSSRSGPITEVTVENGCPAVVPYSHREGLLPDCPANMESPTGLASILREALRIRSGRAGADETRFGAVAHEAHGARLLFEHEHTAIQLRSALQPEWAADGRGVFRVHSRSKADPKSRTARRGDLDRHVARSPACAGRRRATEPQPVGRV